MATQPVGKGTAGAPWSLLLVFFVVYGVQKLTNNFQGLSKLPLRHHLLNPAEQGGLGLDAAQAGAFLTAAAVGWYIKPLFGVASDRLPLFGYRRKSWLILTSFLTSLAWGVLAVWGAGTVLSLFVVVVTINVLISFSDVSCDGLMVEKGRALENSNGLSAGTGNRPLQTAQWTGATLALLAAAGGGGVIAQYFDLRLAATICAGLPLLVGLAVVLFVREEKTQWRGADARAGLGALGLAVGVGWLILTLRGLPNEMLLARWEPALSPVVVVIAVVCVVRIPVAMLAPAALVILWPCMPFNTDSQYFYQYCTQDNKEFLANLETDTTVVPTLRWAVKSLGLLSPDAGGEGGLADVFYGSVLLAGEQVFGLAGIFVLWLTARRARLRTLLNLSLLGWGVTLSLFAVLATGMSTSPPYLMTCVFLGGFFTSVGGMATLFYAAARTPQKNPATVFALLTGLSNLGSMVGVETLGGWLYMRYAGAPESADMRTGNANLGLTAVIGVSFLFLIFLLWLVRWMAKRGYVDPVLPDEASTPAHSVA